jgi:L-aminopeptidase/D-esterase-like protein
MVVTRAALSDMDGVSVGHWTDLTARTGCTVIAFDRHALTAAEVRGAAPGTRELDALAPGRLEQHVDAIVLTGGSAFGLRAADGVAQELASQGRGYPTSAGPVPIVPAAVIYDLSIGEPVAPTAKHGRDALRSARPLGAVDQGVVGAGTGATWDKFIGQPRKGGLGIAQVELGDHLVTAFVVLNAMGVVRGHGDDIRRSLLADDVWKGGQREATTLISVVTTLPCDHGTLIRVCIAAHDALARIVIPAHTMLDGDVAFASTTTDGPRDTRSSMQLCLAAELAVEEAVLNAVPPVAQSSATLIA